ncbi:MAG: hypothetical protein KKE20_06135 [Nanoarchaeota archaeon]|nr:hypothetical protein [Nanoarchaeota archaeon]
MAKQVSLSILKMLLLSVFMALLFSFMSQAYCTDSDGGDDYYTPGYVEAQEPTAGEPESFSDKCVSATKLHEFTCNFPAVERPGLPTYFISELVFDCPNSCVDGACVDAAPVSVETDVSCIFVNSSNTEHECVTDKGSCKGIGSCSVHVKGFIKDKITIKSDCGAETTRVIDGKDKEIRFVCPYDGPPKIAQQTLQQQDVVCPTLASVDCPGGSLVDQGLDDAGCKIPQECLIDEAKSSCNGCLLENDICMEIGQVLKQDVMVYCSNDNKLKPQKSVNESCQNDYECLTKKCMDGKCFDSQRQLSNTEMIGEPVHEKGVLTKIIDWFKGIFS